MKELSSAQVEEVSGGFWIIVARIAFTSLVNMGIYAAKKKHKHEEMTPQGFAIAAGSGALAGGIGGIGGAAAGGGIIGNAVWAPGAQALNLSGNAIAQNY